MDAILLCGGKGTRLASVVSDVPKPLARVDGRPFLDHLLALLRASALVDRVILASGHLAERLLAHYGEHFEDLPLVHSREDSPLGTGGALLLALRRHGDGGPVLVLNGDSYLDADLAALHALLARPGCDLAMAVHAVADAARFGTVVLDDDRVLGFHEKRGRAEPGLINAGIYALRPTALAAWQDHPGALSLETTVLPALVAQGRVAALRTGTRFIDIGLPETYAAAAAFFQPR